jgi:hypothetical protein
MLDIYFTPVHSLILRLGLDSKVASSDLCSRTSHRNMLKLHASARVLAAYTGSVERSACTETQVAAVRLPPLSGANFEPTVAAAVRRLVS